MTRVQEVIRGQAMTPVPLAPPMIEGLINLRGQIVSAIDLRRLLNLPCRPEGATPLNVVVRDGEGAVSLLVDEIGDVLEVDEQSFEQLEYHELDNVSHFLNMEAPERFNPLLLAFLEKVKE